MREKQPELSARDSAEYTLSLPGYDNYNATEKARLMRKLGERTLTVVERPPEPPEAA